MGGRNGCGMVILPYKDGRWMLRWRDPVRRNAKGNRIYHAKVLPPEVTREEAEELRLVYMAHMGKVPKVMDKKISDFMQEYLNWARRQNSFITKKSLATRILDEYGSMYLSQITTLHLEQLQSKLLDEGKKPSTVNGYIAMFKHMFTKAADWGYVDDDCLKKIKKVKLLKNPNHRLRYLTYEEAARLLEICKTKYPQIYPVVVIALNTGMRKNEILSLTWDDIDLVNGYILIKQSKNGTRREIPINNNVRQVLNSIPRDISGGRIFAKNLNIRSDKRSGFGQALKLARIKDFHFHDLRHTFASWLAMSGVDIQTIKELLGHKTLFMTLRYAHLSPSHRRKAVEILDSSGLQEKCTNAP